MQFGDEPNPNYKTMNANTNTVTIQETVRRHIQQHPDMEHLRELSFGCEVELSINHIDPYKAKGRLCGKNDWSDAGDYDHHREKEERLTIQAGWYRGDNYVITDFTSDRYTVVGHSPRLNDYLAVLGKRYSVDGGRQVWFLEDNGDFVPVKLFFNLKTGEPATEEDWKTYAELVGIKL